MFGKNIAAIVYYKIKTTDSVIPLMMEFKKKQPTARLWFLFPDPPTLELIKKNQNLWAAIQFIGAKTISVRQENRVLTLLSLLRLFYIFSFSRTVFIKFGQLPLHNILIALLRKLGRILEIKCFLPPHPKRQLIAKHRLTVYKRKIRGQPLVVDIFSKEFGDYDYFASTITADMFREIYELDPPEKKLLNIGYVRALPEWKKYLENLIASSRYNGKEPYVLYLVSALTKFSVGIEEPTQADSFEESLKVLRKFQWRFKTVFKPNAETREEDIRRVCAKTNFENWEISYEHPMVLAANAKFVVSYYFSNAMLDVFYLGKPILEYRWRDPKVVEMLGGSSSGQEYCDFFSYRDPEKFENDIQTVLSGDYTINRGEELMQEGFKETPPNFFKMIHQFLEEKNDGVAKSRDLEICL